MAPALAPAAGAGPGGLEGELAGPDPPGPGDAGLLETSKVASLALPRPVCDSARALRNGTLVPVRSGLILPVLLPGGINTPSAHRDDRAA